MTFSVWNYDFLKQNFILRNVEIFSITVLMNYFLP